MTQDGSKRKLAAILSADVKGYSIFLDDDEAFTIRTLKEYSGIMSNCIEQHNGRVVDSPGDNLLGEFSSIVDAIQCAVKIQKQLNKKNERLAENKRLEFRIGVNIGDVVQDGDRIYGNGVNVAARIERVADSGRICISRNSYDHVKDKLELGKIRKFGMN
jgi:adenylate cyclase